MFLIFVHMEHEFIWLNAQKCVLPVFFPVDFYYSSNNSTGKETGKSHLCETGCPVISVCLLVSVDTFISQMSVVTIKLQFALNGCHFDQLISQRELSSYFIDK